MRPALHADDELPLDPVILHWLRAYLEAAPERRDGVVAELLRAWNAERVGRPKRRLRRTDPPAAALHNVTTAH